MRYPDGLPTVLVFTSESSALVLSLRQAASFLEADALSLVRLEPDGGATLVCDSDGEAPPEALAVARGSLSPSEWRPPQTAYSAATLADGRHVLVARGATPVEEEPLAQSGAVALTILARTPGAEVDHARLFQDLAADSAPIEDRLQSALERAAGMTGLDAAVMLCVEAEEWNVEAIFDPWDIVDTDALLASGGLASITYRASGAVGVHDVRGHPYPAPGAAHAFLGAPIVSGRHGLGVLAFLGAEPGEEPFPDSCRHLVETLARWAGVALGTRTAEQGRAEHLAALTCVVQASPHPVGIAEWVPTSGSHDDLELTIVNDPAVRMLGAGVGDRLSEVLPPRALRLWTSACRTALSGEAVQRFRTDLSFPGDAEARRFAVTLALVSPPEPGRPARFSFQAEDTTGRRHIRDHLHERDSQLRAVLERAPILLFEVDDTGRFTLCEGRALALSGVRAEDLLGESLFERYKSRPEATQAMGRVLAGESASWQLELGGRTLNVWAEPSRARSGETIGARGVAVDVTEKLEAERIAEEALDEAITDSRHSADLIALLSHGLRVPLATVLGFADLLSEPGTDAPEAGGAIARAAGEILETLDGFVDLTRLSALRTGPPRAVSTPGLEGALVASVAEGAPRAEVSIHVEPIEAPILVDLSLVRAVVHRVASLAGDGPLAVLAEVQREHLCIRLSGSDLSSRFSTDSLDVAYVHHAVSALDADLALGPDGSIGLGIPIRIAPLVVLDDASASVKGDGARGRVPEIVREA